MALQPISSLPDQRETELINGLLDKFMARWRSLKTELGRDKLVRRYGE